MYVPLTPPVVVHSGAAPGFVWQDLDLSSVIGERNVLVYIGVYSGTTTMAMRQKGETYEVYAEQYAGTIQGMSKRYFNATQTLGFLVKTNSDGVIQWKSQAPNFCKVVVYGYLEISDVDIHLGTFVKDTNYNEIDLSSIIGGAKPAYVYLRIRGDDVNYYNDYVAARYKGGSPIYPGQTGVSNCTFTSRPGWAAATRNVNYIATVTDENGIIEVRCQQFSGPGGDYNVDLIGYADHDGEGGSALVYSGNSPQGSVLTLDLSSHIGEVTALVDLLLYPTQINGVSIIAWPYGDSEPWASGAALQAPSVNAGISSGWGGTGYNSCQIQVPTNSEGKIQWTAYEHWSYTRNIYLVGYTLASIFEIESIEPSYLGLRVNFSKGCKNDVELNNIENYQIIVSEPESAFDFGIVDVIPEPDVTYPTYVDLVTTDCTHGEDYEVVITPDKITSFEDDLLSDGNNAKEFVGVSEMPEVLAVISLSLTQVKVVFSKYMTQRAELYAASSYIWTGGIRTLKVEPDTNSSVILTTTEMVKSQIYDLTVG